ncbi:unnamed protein product [Pseudo-nitzschia multistriata]|uniref:Uncharacterized protein n=1 Tax=Pseudo-nitzschia multistriata TaxID=183589 RepID=A0A448Z9W6_9STRA|nr:unnamed protein product [Pseudo-nitzschia multistriata]
MIAAMAVDQAPESKNEGPVSSRAETMKHDAPNQSLREEDRLGDDSPIGFGKYRGKTYRFVALNDPVYCWWARGQDDDPSPEMAAFHAWIDSRMIDLLSTAHALHGTEQVIGLDESEDETEAHDCGGLDCDSSTDGGHNDEDRYVSDVEGDP